LALLAGYLCAMASFEWAQLWDFAAFVFRPLAATLLSLAFLVCLALHQLPRQRRLAACVPALVWLSVAAWPLRLGPVTATLTFSVLSLGLLLATLSRGRAVLALLLCLPAALWLLAGSPSWPVGGVLVLAGLLELRLWRDGGREGAAEASASSARRRLEGESDSRTVEISWKGFAALFKAALPGEGERFTTTVLADTSSIIETCGGRRVKGSDLDGTYRFPNEACAERCLEQLERYRAQIAGVLQEANAPPLQLMVARR
jgi:hypothetical protein